MSEETSRSASNVLRLVLMLSERGSLRVTGVAEELNVAPSTAHRMLTALAQAGFAVQAEGRTYVPGPAYLRLHRPAGDPDALIALAAPYLTELSAATGETSHLMVMDGASVRFIHSIEGTAALRVASRVGALIPAHLTSGGKAMLALMAADEVRELVEPCEADALLDELAVIRDHRIAENLEQSEPGICAAGIAFRRHHLVGAFSLSMPSIRYRASREYSLDELLIKTADAIESHA